MQYTSTYQLNQWEKTDRVLRTDFNNDNQKIEEALMNVARYFFTLHSYFLLSRSGRGSWLATQRPD